MASTNIELQIFSSQDYGPRELEECVNSMIRGRGENSIKTSILPRDAVVEADGGPVVVRGYDIIVECVPETSEFDSDVHYSYEQYVEHHGHMYQERELPLLKALYENFENPKSVFLGYGQLVRVVYGPKQKRTLANLII